MNFKVFEDYQYTEFEIKDLTERIAKLERQLEQVSSEEVVDVVQAGDIRTGHMKIHGIQFDRISLIKAQLERTKLTLETRKNKILEDRADCEEFINNIEDSRVRVMAEYKFIDGLTWTEVAKKIGPGYTADACYKYFIRYFAEERLEQRVTAAEKEKQKSYFKGNA